MSTLCEKHRPKKLEDIKGQSHAVEVLVNFIKRFEAESSGSLTRGKKAVLLHGSGGTGKTSLAHALANEINAEIFELNSSDLRNKKKLQEILRPAVEQQSLFKKTKLILVDEVDGVTGSDRGGIPELADLIRNTTIPMILTANDAWTKKLSDVRKISELVRLKELSYSLIKDVLKEISIKESLKVDEGVLVSIAIRSKGDLRAAINDLQALSQLPTAEKIQIADLPERNKAEDIFNAMKKVFQVKPTNDTLEVFNSVNMPIEEISLWIEENIPKIYKGEELAYAYERLSRADIFKGRIYKQQYWRFLVYQNILLSYGIAAAKKSDVQKKGFIKYERPKRILKIWLSNRRNAQKKTIASKYARYVHMNKKRAMAEFKMIQPILKKQKVQKELDLSDDEINYLERY